MSRSCSASSTFGTTIASIRSPARETSSSTSLRNHGVPTALTRTATVRGAQSPSASAAMSASRASSLAAGGDRVLEVEHDLVDGYPAPLDGHRGGCGGD